MENNVQSTFTLQKRSTVRQKCQVYCVAFNHSEVNRKIFAVCGRENVSVYECEPTGSIKLLVSYVEKDDSFWTCVWAEDTCLAAGNNGIIRMVKSTDCSTRRGFRGHCQGITELKVKPRQSNLVLSASKDGTVRLWNIRSMTCVAIYVEATHTQKQVLSVDFHSSLDMFASVAADDVDFKSTISIWKLGKDVLREAIAKSHGDSFESVSYCKPIFQLKQSDTFGAFVVCIKWHRDYLLSYSYERLIWLQFCPTSKWLENLVAGHPNEKTAALDVHDFKAETLANFVTKFDIFSDDSGFLLAAGCENGMTNLWRVHRDFNIIEHLPIVDPRSSRTRQCAFSRDGTVLITVHDDGHIRRFDLPQSID